MGAIVHPAFPAPSVFQEGQSSCIARAPRAAGMRVHVCHLITRSSSRLDRAIQYSRASGHLGGRNKYATSALRHGERRVQQGRLGVFLTGLCDARALRPGYLPRRLRTRLGSPAICKGGKAMKIVVIGGTGLIGSKTVTNCEGRPRGRRRLAQQRYQRHHRRGPQGGRGRCAGGDRPRQFALI